MKKKGFLAVVFLPMLFICLALGCGKQEDSIEYGVDGYVYPSRLIGTEEGIASVKAIGEYLYFVRDMEDEVTLERILLAQLASKEAEEYSDSIVLARIPKESSGLRDKNREEIDFLAHWEENNDSEMQCLFRLGGYAVDQIQNIYFYVEVATIDNYSTVSVEGIVCKQSAEGELAYCTYLPQVLDIAVDEKGRAYTLADDKIWVLDQEGSILGSISTDGYRKEGEFAAQELFMDSEDGVYYCARDAGAISDVYKTVWDGKHMLEKIEDFPGRYAYRTACSNGSFLFYSKDSGNTLYEYDEKYGMHKVLRWPDSGLMSMDIDWVVRAAPDVLLAGSGNDIYQLNRTSVEELPERELLVMASVNGGSYNLQKAVMEFNAQNGQYRIVIDDYGAYYSEQDECWECPRLDACLASSASPDLLDLHLLNIFKYADKGVLEDLNPYLEKSTLLTKDDYIDNLIEGMKIKGSLVCIPKSFQIQGVALRRSQAGGTDSWTMEDLYRLTEKVPGTVNGLVSDGYGGWKQRDYLLEELCPAYYLERFVDWENGKCDFDSEEFRRLLAWVAEHGGQGSTGETDGWRQYVPEEALMVSLSRLDFLSFFYLEAQCGEEVVLRGFPTVDGNGRFRATAQDAMSIASESRHKEAAWEFLEYFLSSGSGNEFGFLDFSASKSELQQGYEEAVAPKYEEGSNNMTAKSIRYVADQWIPYYVTPKEQADAIMEAVETADFTPLSEEEEAIIRIVTEEAAEYCSGVKGLEEVTEVIQNRVQLLLNEKGA